MKHTKAATIANLTSITDTLVSVEAKVDTHGKTLGHAKWMAKTALENQNHWPEDKLNRWLGYVQASLVFNDILPMQTQRIESRVAYHAAYKESGIPIPPSVGPETESST